MKIVDIQKLVAVTTKFNASRDLMAGLRSETRSIMPSISKTVHRFMLRCILQANVEDAYDAQLGITMMTNLNSIDRVLVDVLYGIFVDIRSMQCHEVNA